MIDGHLVRPGEDVLDCLITLPADTLAGLDQDTLDVMLPARLRTDLRRFAADTRTLWSASTAWAAWAISPPLPTLRPMS